MVIFETLASSIICHYKDRMSTSADIARRSLRKDFKFASVFPYLSRSGKVQCFKLKQKRLREHKSCSSLHLKIFFEELLTRI